MPQKQISEKESSAPSQLFKAVFTHLLRGSSAGAHCSVLPRVCSAGARSTYGVFICLMSSRKNIELIYLEEPSDEVG